MSAARTLHDLLGTLPQQGQVRWIGVRPARHAAMACPEEVLANAGAGLSGDRFAGTAVSKRQVTLIQYEHLLVIGELLARAAIDPALLRRNLAVSGINLQALHRAQFRIGDAVLLGTGACHPCSRMEEVLGTGGYNAMRGHGGITAQVIQSGAIRIGDPVQFISVAAAGQ